MYLCNMENINVLKNDLIAWIQQVNQIQVLQKMLAFKQEQQTIADKKRRETLFFSLAGSWETAQTGEELTALIYQARQDTPREVIL